MGSEIWTRNCRHFVTNNSNSDKKCLDFELSGLQKVGIIALNVSGFQGVGF